MQETLLIKLLDYILNNNPELLLTLNREGKLSAYLKDKINSINLLAEELLIDGRAPFTIEETCMDELTKDLRPSKYNYIVSVLTEEFDADYHELVQNGILIPEVCNLISICLPLFQLTGFSEENESDRNLRYAIIRETRQYFKNIF